MELFPILPALPSGFAYIPSFLTNEEEQALLNFVTSIELHTFIFQGYEAKRKVASFGFDYSFSDRTIKKGKPIPREFEPLIRKVSEVARIDEEFAELLITEYPIGAVINWHRDAPPFEVIAGISLAAPCEFKFRPYEKAKQGRRAILTIKVDPRSLYIMRGESRTEWEHSTAPVKNVRYSITLRTLRAQRAI